MATSAPVAAVVDPLNLFLVRAPATAPVVARPIGVVDANGNVVQPTNPPMDTWETVGVALSLAGAALGTYHGYKRNDSVGWALGWGLFGSLVPVLAIPLALAQGLSTRKR